MIFSKHTLFRGAVMLGTFTVFIPVALSFVLAYFPRHYSDTVDPLAIFPQAQPHTIRTADDVNIHAWLIIPVQKSTRGVVLVHGHGDSSFANRGTPEDPIAKRVGKPLLRANFTVLSLDLRNHGRSPYRPPFGGGYMEYEDVRAGIRFLRNFLGPGASIGVFGESLGASTVLLALCDGDETEDVKAVVLDSPFATLHTTANYYLSRFGAVPEWFSSAVVALCGGMVMRNWFDETNFSPQVCARRTPGAVLHTHGEQDDTIPYEETELLREALTGRANETEYRFVPHTGRHCKASLEMNFTDMYVAHFDAFL